MWNDGAPLYTPLAQQCHLTMITSQTADSQTSVTDITMQARFTQDKILILYVDGSVHITSVKLMLAA